MTIRSTVVVGLLVLGSGAIALSQEVSVPGFAVASQQRGGAPKTTLTTPPLDADQGTGFQTWNCSIVNVGKSPLSISADPIKIFNQYAQELTFEEGVACVEGSSSRATPAENGSS